MGEIKPPAEADQRDKTMVMQEAAATPRESGSPKPPQEARLDGRAERFAAIMEKMREARTVNDFLAAFDEALGHIHGEAVHNAQKHAKTIQAFRESVEASPLFRRTDHHSSQSPTPQQGITY